VLTGKGVTAWRRAVTELAPDPPILPAAPGVSTRPALPTQIAAELINALAAVALAGA
jgi:hypothetical protein